MKALVVYDSAFGNTAQIAQAIGGALGSQEAVTILQVGNVAPDQLSDVKLLVVGSPTQGFRPTQAITDFLKSMSVPGLNGVKVAAFDTRLSTDENQSFLVRFIVGIGGYAAKTIASRLSKSGGDLLVPPEGFFVEGKEGPLKAGELERAAGWAKQILAAQATVTESIKPLEVAH
jgi:flavodoxin